MTYSVLRSERRIWKDELANNFSATYCFMLNTILITGISVSITRKFKYKCIDQTLYLQPKLVIKSQVTRFTLLQYFKEQNSKPDMMY